MDETTNERADKTDALLREEIKVVNIGLTLFTESMRAQGVRIAHVAWQPPASGKAELADLLKDLL